MLIFALHQRHFEDCIINCVSSECRRWTSSTKLEEILGNFMMSLKALLLHFYIMSIRFMKALEEEAWKLIILRLPRMWMKNRENFKFPFIVANQKRFAFIMWHVLLFTRVIRVHGMNPWIFFLLLSLLFSCSLLLHTHIRSSPNV